MGRLFFSLFSGFALFVGLALVVWKTTESNSGPAPAPDNSRAQALVAGPTSTPYPDPGPQPPAACKQFVALIPADIGLDRNAGESVIVDIARGTPQTLAIWRTAPALRDTLWD